MTLAHYRVLIHHLPMWLTVMAEYLVSYPQQYSPFIRYPTLHFSRDLAFMKQMLEVNIWRRIYLKSPQLINYQHFQICEEKQKLFKKMNFGDLAIQRPVKMKIKSLGKCTAGRYIARDLQNVDICNNINFDNNLQKALQLLPIVRASSYSC